MQGLVSTSQAKATGLNVRQVLLQLRGFRGRNGIFQWRLYYFISKVVKIQNLSPSLFFHRYPSEKEG